MPPIWSRKEHEIKMKQWQSAATASAMAHYVGKTIQRTETQWMEDIRADKVAQRLNLAQNIDAAKIAPVANFLGVEIPKTPRHRSRDELVAEIAVDHKLIKEREAKIENLVGERKSDAARMTQMQLDIHHLQDRERLLNEHGQGLEGRLRQMHGEMEEMERKLKMMDLMAREARRHAEEQRQARDNAIQSYRGLTSRISNLCCDQCYAALRPRRTYEEQTADRSWRP